MNKKYQVLGHNTKVLIDLHLQDPKSYHAALILDLLVKEYEKLGFNPVEE